MTRSPGDQADHRRVVEANVELHSNLAARYDEFEPHFRPENVARVEGRLVELVAATGARRLLDLGCGTGFMIGIARNHLERIDGVDVTPAMLARVDTSGPAAIALHESDTESFEPEAGAYDLVTAYSFLHHLFDPRPTLAVAARALRPGGILYADLDPNRAFWEAIGRLDRSARYDPVVERELAQLEYEDERMQAEYGVSKEVFDAAEYGKNVRGGFTAEQLTEDLTGVGFSEVEVTYHWFLGEGRLIHDETLAAEHRLVAAEATADALRRGLPLTGHLFKYLAVRATR